MNLNHFDLNVMPDSDEEAALFVHEVDRQLTQLMLALQDTSRCTCGRDHSDDIHSLTLAVEQMIVCQHIYRIACDAFIGN